MSGPNDALLRTVEHWAEFKQLKHAEAESKRGDDLEGQGLNGVKLALVDIPAGAVPPHALVDLYFFNDLHLDDIETEIVGGVRTPKEVFPLTGGRRLPAGSATGDVQTVGLDVRDDRRLRVGIAPIGDYSTYTLTVVAAGIDPFFQSIDFKFRPGCFNNCAPEWPAPPAPGTDPVIDYLAKDYESFRHAMIAWMSGRVPGWEATSEADLDMVILELFSGAADHLSDFQDRVMNEAYLGSARKRVSVARHAHLMDYHIHQGNQASTWQVLQVEPGLVPILQDGLSVTTSTDGEDEPQVFVTHGTPEPLLTMAPAVGGDLDGALLSPAITSAFGAADRTLSGTAVIAVLVAGAEWHIDDAGNDRLYVLQLVDGRVAAYEPRYHPLLNGIGLHSWSDTVRTLAAGSTSADLRAASEDDARLLTTLLRSEAITHLVIQEHLNPATGSERGRDPTRRQILRLLAGEDAAEALEDPIDGSWLVRVRWDERDPLERNYCFMIDCDGALVDDVSLFHGNLAEVYHGETVETTFRPPHETLGLGECHYAVRQADAALRTGTEAGDAAEGVVTCRLPVGPLAYTNTEPGGERRTRSTLDVVVSLGGQSDPWDEVVSLVHSDDSSEGGDHFVVETDELGRSLIRFGNGINGRKLPDGADVVCTYQVGAGPDGNVGSDTLTELGAGLDAIFSATWNPFDVTDGRAAEPVAEILRRVPEAYRARQLRAVTLRDYVERAEEVDGVSAAAARYVWTGSWRGVRVTIDPAGTTELAADLVTRVSRHLEAVRLIGEDLEIRPPRFVPLDIVLSVCIHPDYWPEDIRFFLEQEFSDGYTADERLAFFHPDRWTFGQELRASQIIGRAQAIQGVDHVTEVSLRRWSELTPGTPDRITVGPSEIILVRNDRDSMEEGSIRFSIGGGRG